MTSLSIGDYIRFNPSLHKPDTALGQILKFYQYNDIPMAEVITTSTHNGTSWNHLFRVRCSRVHEVIPEQEVVLLKLQGELSWSFELFRKLTAVQSLD